MPDWLPIPEFLMIRTEPWSTLCAFMWGCVLVGLSLAMLDQAQEA